MRCSIITLTFFLSLFAFQSHSQTKDILSKELTGEWFLNNQSMSLRIGIYKDRVAYNSEIWEYDKITSERRITTVHLKQGDRNAILQLQMGKDHRLILLAGNTKEVLSRKPSGKRKYSRAEDYLPSPIINPDTATYNGYIKNYSDKLGFKTGQLFLGNLITGTSDTFLINVKPDGSFNVRIPMNYPLECMVKFERRVRYIYLQPGEKTLHLFDVTDDQLENNLFVGAFQDVNTDYDFFKPTLSKLQKIYKDIYNFNANQYKSYFLNLQERELALLQKYSNTVGMSRRSQMLLSQNIKFRIANSLIEISNTLGTAKKLVENTPFVDRYEFDNNHKLSLEYLNFLQNLPFEKDHKVISFNYFMLLSRIANLEVVNNETKLARYQVYAAELQKKDNLTLTEKYVSKSLNDILEHGFDDKYLKPYLSRLSTMDTVLKDRFFETEQVIIERKNRNRRSVLKKLTGKDLIFEQEILFAQELTQNDRLREYHLLDSNELINIKNQFTRSEIFKIVSSYNFKWAMLAVKSSSKGEGIDNRAPKTQGDRIFNELIDKFKGKVIYIDFWATWCGPCKDAMQLISPMKDELKNENIVFMYITNFTSPTNTYNMTIPGIRREHYRLDNDQYNFLAEKFKIVGIPHYALVDKQGTVVNGNFRLHGEALKSKLLELSKN